MLLFKSRQIALVLLCLWLLIVSTTCSNIGTTPSVATSTTQPKIDTPPSSTLIPATSTTCPAAGKGRVAIMPPLKLGTHQTIVYLADLSQGNNGPTPPMTLERYDVSTGKASIITDGLIRTALLSHDGQWLMLGVLEGTAYQIQLIRLDGQDRQTLYCTPQGQPAEVNLSINIQWSPDQTHLLFTQGASDNSQSLFLLDLSSGKVQLELSPAGNDQSFQPITWLDKTKVVLLQQTSFDRSGLYLLDTSKGANQHINDMQLLAKPAKGIEPYNWDFEISADGGILFQSTRISLLRAYPKTERRSHC